MRAKDIGKLGLGCIKREIAQEKTTGKEDICVGRLVGRLGGRARRLDLLNRLQSDKHAAKRINDPKKRSRSD